MKKFNLLLLATGLLLGSGQLKAQRDPAAREAAMKQKLMSELKLTDIQADSVVAINRSTMPARRALFQDQTLSQDDKRARMMAMSDSADTRLKGVLGDSLFTQYNTWRKNNRQGRMGGGGGR